MCLWVFPFISQSVSEMIPTCSLHIEFYRVFLFVCFICVSDHFVQEKSIFCITGLLVNGGIILAKSVFYLEYLSISISKASVL